MKRLLFLLALAAGTVHAQSLVLSEFSSFAPDYYSQPFPADTTSWSSLTAQSGATAFSIGDFGDGAAGGNIGNGFIQFLSAETDWSAYSTVTLSGLASPTNATPSLFFYVESVETVDGGDVVTSSLSAFDLADFDSDIAMLSVTVPLSFAGIDPTRVTAWGFVVQEQDNPAFGFAFDRVEIAAIPEPGTYALLIGGVTLIGVMIRRSRNRMTARRMS